MTFVRNDVRSGSIIIRIAQVSLTVRIWSTPNWTARTHAHSLPKYDQVLRVKPVSIGGIYSVLAMVWTCLIWFTPNFINRVAVSSDESCHTSVYKRRKFALHSTTLIAGAQNVADPCNLTAMKILSFWPRFTSKNIHTSIPPSNRWSVSRKTI